MTTADPRRPTLADVITRSRSGAAAAHLLHAACAGRLPAVLPVRRSNQVLLWLLALLITGSATALAITTSPAQQVGLGPALVAGVAAGVPLAVLVTRPLLGWAVSAGAGLVVAPTILTSLHGDPWPWPPHGLVLLALLVAVCIRESLPVAAATGITTVALTWTNPLTSVVIGAVALIGLLTGRLVRKNRRIAEQAEQHARERARRVVLEERNRIARELHDIVAHHMSLIAVRAETAPYRVPDLPAAAREELGSITEAARTALAETRALLSVLRRDDDGALSAPQPGLDQLGQLVDKARRAGVDLDAELDRDLTVLRPGTSLAAYRIAQEALSNATRHAPGAPVHLAVRREADAVRLYVSSGRSPEGPPALPTPGAPGHGITGMRERARAEGGDLTVTETPDGKFVIDARLPLHRP